MKLKKDNPSSFTDENQLTLDNIAEKLIDIDEELDKIMLDGEKPEEYVVPAGTEDLVHLQIIRGRRFNPMTGEEESEPYNQMFSKGEFDLFKMSYKSLGYSVLKVLHDPTGEAHSLIII